tara:strand:- start:3010 stop:3633 length:624 start_codon:yes stop_codon:yes gene_type:complete
MEQIMEQELSLSCSETAKLVRVALKKEFPNQKFSVRSSVYSGGASINVNWEDGVSTKEVDNVIKSFEGSGFDGMIDLKYYKKHWILPNGDVVLKTSEGTSGSGGVYHPCENEKPHPDAKKVSFGADYVFSNRTIKPETFEKIARLLAELEGIEFKSIDSYPEWFGKTNSNWYSIIHELISGRDLTNFKRIVKTDVLSGNTRDFFRIE